MPLYECSCESCGYVHQELLSHSQFDDFRTSLSDGDYSHVVEFEDGRTDVCGTFRFKMSIPNVHSASGAYPFDTPPYMLPPKVVDGKVVPNIVTVNNRTEHKALLKANGMIDPETPGERLTMYEDRPESNKAKLDSDIDKDMRMYNHMLKNPHDRKRVIRENIAKSRSVLNATG